MMKILSKNYKKVLFFSTLSVNAVLWYPMAMASPAAQDMSDPSDASFTCSNAVNVMDCISQTQSSGVRSADPKSVINGLNSSSFGLTGPVSLSVRYDDQLSWIIDGAYAQKFGNHVAVGLKGSYGPNEYRGNATLGFGITPNQQFKLTYEYLAQNLPFDFTAGTVNEWVNQNAFGGAYRYLFANNTILKGIEVSGSYTKANSKELSEVYLQDSAGNINRIDQRRIAGGQQQSGLASVIINPFTNTIVKAGAGYSASSFDTKWESNQSQATIAYDVEASHLITPKTLISASVNNNATSLSNSVKISRILPANLEGNLGGQYNLSHVDGIDNNSSVTVGLSYPAPKSYTNMFAGSLGDLKAWVQQPVVYNTRVLAVAEERILSTQISANTISSASISAGLTLNPVVQTQEYFKFNTESFDKVVYQISNIIKKNDPSVTFPASYLSLELTPQNAYNWILQSSAPMSAAAMQPGQYTLILSATGYRGTQIVGNGSASMDITVTGNSDLTAPSWDGNTLKQASIGQTYPGTDLNTLVQDNSGLPAPGDKYVFQIKGNPSWIGLDTPDGHNLVGYGPVPSGTAASVPVQIKATSVVSSKAITGGTPDAEGYSTFYIAVNSTANAPQWVTNPQLTAAVYQMPYPVKSLQDFLKPDPNSVDVRFDCVSNGCTYNQNTNTYDLPIEGMHLEKLSGNITGTPTNPQQVKLAPPASFDVKATNSAGKSSTQTFTLAVNSNSGLNPPSWIGANNSFPNAYVGGTYNVDLNTLFKSPYSGDSISYELTKTQGLCDWLDLKGSSLVAISNIVDTTNDCKIKVKATSFLSGQPTTVTYPLTVLPAAPSFSKSQIDETYYANNPVNLNDIVVPAGSYDYSVTSGTLPTGLSLVNGVIQGPPSSVDQIQTPITVKITTVSKTNSSFKNDIPLTITVNPNGAISFDPKLSSLPSGIPGKQYTDASGAQVDLNKYVNFTLPSGEKDKFKNFKLTSSPNTCNGNNWSPALGLNSNGNGVITSGTPSNENSCQMTFEVISVATGNPATITGTINTTADVAWTDKLLWNGTMPTYYGGAKPSENIDSSYVYSRSSSTGGSINMVNELDLKPSYVTVTNGAQAKVDIDTNALNAVGDNSATPCANVANSKLKLNATSTAGGNAVAKTFDACLLPNPALTPANISSSLKSGAFGVEYSLFIDPYDGNAQQQQEALNYVTPTKQGDKIVPDNLTFKLEDGDNVSNGKACGWLQLSNIGTDSWKLSGTNLGGMPVCNFSIRMTSKARGDSSVFPVSVTVSGSQPTWNLTNFPKTLMFTQINTSGIDLTGYFNPGTSYNDPYFKLLIDDAKSTCYSSMKCSDLWELVPKTGGGYYLSRKLREDGTIDAKSVGSTDKLTMDAYNSAAPNGVSQELNIITITGNPAVKFKWKNLPDNTNNKNKNTNSNTNTISNTNILSLGNLTDYIQTYITKDDGTELDVTNDSITLGVGTGCRDGKNILYLIKGGNSDGSADQCIYPTGVPGNYSLAFIKITSYFNGTYILKPNDDQQNNDDGNNVNFNIGGFYDPTFKDFSSKARDNNSTKTNTLISTEANGDDDYLKIYIHV